MHVLIHFTVFFLQYSNCRFDFDSYTHICNTSAKISIYSRLCCLLWCGGLFIYLFVCILCYFFIKQKRNKKKIDWKNQPKRNINKLFLFPYTSSSSAVCVCVSFKYKCFKTKTSFSLLVYILSSCTFE